MKPLLERFIRKDLEAGQAIVLIALFMVLLLGTLGLAIDGGGLLLLWRDAQNAADTSVLQASYALCTAPEGTNANAASIEAGKAAADENGFITSTNVSRGTSTTVTVSPQPSNYGTNYVEVIIEADKPSYFIQLLYGGRLSVRATALAYCTRAIDSSSLPGMYAGGDPTFCTQAEIGITGANITVVGNAHTNGDVDFNPAGSANNTGTYSGALTYVGELDDHGKVSYPEPSTASQTSSQPFPELVDLSEYDIVAGGSIAQAVVASGGKAYTVTGDWNNAMGTNQNGQTVDMRTNGRLEGLIYVRGDAHITDKSVWYHTGSYNFSAFTPAIWRTGYELNWPGVTLIADGDIQLSFNTDSYLRYYDKVTVGDDYPAIVLASNTESVSCDNSSEAISHTGEVRLYGVLYAPRGSISLSFSGVDFWGIIYAKQRVSLSGSDSDLYLDPSLLVSRPPSTQRVYQP